MTIEELCKCDAATLATFTDQQLYDWFKPMFPVTRPDETKMVMNASGNMKRLSLTSGSNSSKRESTINSAMKAASMAGIPGSHLMDLFKRAGIKTK